MVNTTSISNTTAHAGRSSLKVPGASGERVVYNFNPITPSEQLNSQGLQFKLWVKGDLETDKLKVRGNQGINGPKYFPFVKISQVGEWTLYEADVIYNWALNSGTHTTVDFSLLYGGSNEIFLDDIRMQPMDSEMKTYVYDTKTLRLLTSFDDQHFGLYYQYNAEGQLVRKMIETERGMKTITETNYNTPTNTRKDELGY